MSESFSPQEKVARQRFDDVLFFDAVNDGGDFAVRAEHRSVVYFCTGIGRVGRLAPWFSQAS